MKWIVLTLLFAGLASEASAMNLNTDKVQSFTVNRENIATLTVTKSSYFQGYIRSSQPLEQANIQSSDGRLTKVLISSPTKEAELFWYAETAGDYQIKLQTTDTAEVSILLKSVALKENQYVSPQAEISSPLIKKTADQIESGNQQATAQFWHQVDKQGGTPLVEYTNKNSAIVTFLYRGEVNNVRVLGSPYGGHAHLSQLAGSDIWFRSFQVPDSTRLSYRVAPNVPQLKEHKSRRQRRAVLATAAPDPLNQSPLFGEGDNLFGPASTMTLSEAPDDSVTRANGMPEGSVSHHVYSGDSLSRRLAIYQPHKSYPIENNAPLLVLFDGDAYLDKVPTAVILDNLIAKKRIPPMRALFINPPLPGMRGKELTPNKAYADFVANELMPWLCKNKGICPEPENTILSGSSYGGLASVYIALQHPQRFGKVLSQSGSFWWTPEKDSNTNFIAGNWMAEQVRSEPKKDLQFYLTAGLFETEPKSNSILDTNRQLYNTLKSGGYHVSLKEAAAGHDYFSWRVMLAEGLIELFTNKNNS